MKVLVEFSDEEITSYSLDTVKLIIIEEKTGIQTIKYVSMESLASVLHASLETKKMCSVGPIPFGYYNAKICVEGGGFGCRAILIVPKKVHRITYMNTAYDIELPSTVFGFWVEKYCLIRTKVFCMENRVPSGKCRLYHFPLGNVREDGHVCWGNNPLPRIERLLDLESLIIRFFAYPFNSDYFQPGLQCRIKDYNLRDLCEYVHRTGEFEEKKLLEPIVQAGVRTLGEFQKTMEI